MRGAYLTSVERPQDALSHFQVDSSCRCFCHCPRGHCRERGLPRCSVVDVVEARACPAAFDFLRHVDARLTSRRSIARTLTGASCLRHDKELSRFRASNFLLMCGARESHQRERHPGATPFGHPCPQGTCSVLAGLRLYVRQLLLRCSTSGIRQLLLHCSTSGIHALAMPSPCTSVDRPTSCRPPCGLSATTDHRRSGAPLKGSALQARRKNSNSHRAGAQRSSTRCREAVGRTR